MLSHWPRCFDTMLGIEWDVDMDLGLSLIWVFFSYFIHNLIRIYMILW